jgi:Sperm-tail PG-rich repeat
VTILLVMELVYSFLSEGMDQRPAYGFSHRLRAAVEKEQITPSPLDYYAERVNLRSSKAYTFGHRTPSMSRRQVVTPGPGEYFIAEDLKPPRRKSGYSFGSKSSARRALSHSPGPNKYDVVSHCSMVTNRGFSFGHRTQSERKIPPTPGPAHYNSDKLLLKSSPAYSFGRESRSRKRERNDMLRNQTPAPFDYRPEASLWKSSPAYSFGSKSRVKVFAVKDQSTPGPGEYEVYQPTWVRQGKGFSFGMRVSWIDLKKQLATFATLTFN